MANTLRIGGGMGLRLWRGADLALNYERVVAKPASEPDSQTIRLTVRQLWKDRAGSAGFATPLV